MPGWVSLALGRQKQTPCVFSHSHKSRTCVLTPNYFLYGSGNGRLRPHPFVLSHSPRDCLAMFYPLSFTLVCSPWPWGQEADARVRWVQHLSPHINQSLRPHLHIWVNSSLWLQSPGVTVWLTGLGLPSVLFNRVYMTQASGVLVVWGGHVICSLEHTSIFFSFLNNFCDWWYGSLKVRQGPDT